MLRPDYPVKISLHQLLDDWGRVSSLGAPGKERGRTVDLFEFIERRGLDNVQDGYDLEDHEKTAQTTSD